jgi:hypothetical protein
MNNTWSIVALWNKSFEAKPQRKIEKRDYIYASELGSAPIDVFLKMQGVPPTNPPNARSLRKFEAGNLIEFCLRFVLTRSGILKETQTAVKYALPGLLAVSGRLDFITGETLDFTQAEKDIEALHLPEFFDFTAKRMIEYFKANYANIKLQQYIIECKSCSSFIFERNERANTANSNHQLQSFHYSKGLKLPAKIIYICKDDCRLQEYEIAPNQPDILKKYKAYIGLITRYYEAGERPHPEQPIEWDEQAFRFSKNWRIEYSNYLTMIYGFQQPDDFFNTYQPMVERMNRVYKRCVKGDKMTDANKEVIREAKGYFPEWDELVDAGIKNGIFEEETETA